MILLRNPARKRERAPGDKVRTRISCEDQGLEVEIVVNGGSGSVGRVTLTCDVPKVDGDGTEALTFTLVNGLPAS